MLRTETVERTTLELIKALMLDERLKQFNLVGGTALSLYIGHRKSIDLDLFSHQQFNKIELEKYLNSAYAFKDKNPDSNSKFTLLGFINDIKVDFVWDDSLQVNPLYTYGSFRIASIYDIAAMKLKAILQNGERLKDFVDVAFLSTKMTLNTMLDVFDVKYPSTSNLLAVKALTYFDDIDLSAEIELTEGVFNWEKIRKRLNEMVVNSNKKFHRFPV
ncbi:MAG: nucleotidyl transferase AbiEii/AbiGii toxin family protein [Tannerella sp.]|nr:nucleotidyl transferase AbiEii/AbiGii toxin family protein [Tannerella sp.]